MSNVRGLHANRHGYYNPNHGTIYDHHNNWVFSVFGFLVVMAILFLLLLLNNWIKRRYGIDCCPSPVNIEATRARERRMQEWLERQARDTEMERKKLRRKYTLALKNNRFFIRTDNIFIKRSKDSKEEKHLFCCVPFKGVNKVLRVRGYCSICLDEIHENQTITWSTNCECPHVFHNSCIMEWLVKAEAKGMCPECRRVFVPEVDGCKDSTNTIEDVSGGSNDQILVHYISGVNETATRINGPLLDTQDN